MSAPSWSSSFSSSSRPTILFAPKLKMCSRTSGQASGPSGCLWDWQSKSVPPATPRYVSHSSGLHGLLCVKPSLTHVGPLYPQLRSFAAVIFRRIASKTRKNISGENVDLFISLERQHSTAIRAKLLETLLTESDKNVRNKISDAVAEVARQYAETGLSRNPPLRCN